MNTTTIRMEGGLLSPDFLERIADAAGQTPRDFGLDGRRALPDEITSVWADAQTYWKAFERRRAHAATEESVTTITRETWVLPLLEALGYTLTYQKRAAVVDGRTFMISHRAAPIENRNATLENETDALPVHIVGYDLKLGDRPPSGRGTLSPHGLVQDYLNRTEHLWSLVTNGLTLRLLRDSTFFSRPSYIEFDLKQMLEGGRLDEFILLYRLVHRTRLPQTPQAAEQCWLEQYHQQAREQGNRIRDGLRDAVAQAIVTFANGFLAHPRNTALRAQVQADALPARELYRQLLYLIYRLLFLFVAEERSLLLAREGHADPSTTVDAYAFYFNNYSLSRLRALSDEPLTAPERFDDLYLGLRSLFYMLGDESAAAPLGLPVLNGELFHELRVLDNAWLSNRALLTAIHHLSYFTPLDEQVRRRVNYAALDVEELGSVYESLLDLEPVIHTVQGNPEFYFAQGDERRSTGSHYTAPPLVSELIQHTLVPVMQERLAAAKNQADQKKALLALKVLDLSVGSGHFLLAAARVLGRELAKLETDTDEPSPEAVREGIRQVITHCIYGVDKNPLAVDLCKVALWLEGHAEGKPLTFLDHRIRCGDSLVGVTDLAVLKNGIPDEAFEPVAGDDKKIAMALKKRNRTERVQHPMQFDANQEMTHLNVERRALLEAEDETPAQIRRKRAVYQELQVQDLRDRTACNLWTAAFFVPLTQANLEAKQIATTQVLRDFLDSGREDRRFTGMANALAQEDKHPFFHWILEFPEVFAQGGFDVVIGNPPFVAGVKISAAFGDQYRNYLSYAFDPFVGQADLCGAMFRRAFEVMKPNGTLGLVATNTISQGDTRQSSLAVIVKQGGVIKLAHRFIKWPGVASVEVNLLAIHKGKWNKEAHLDQTNVDFISSRLDMEPEKEPETLRQNEGRGFRGQSIGGEGFILEPDELSQLLRRNTRNQERIFPYLNGEDLNGRVDQSAGRLIIDFTDMSLDEAREYENLIAILEKRVQPYRAKSQSRQEREKWWMFARPGTDMRAAIKPLEYALVRSRVSEQHMLAFVPTNYVLGDALVVFAFEDFYNFTVLQSSLHEVWLRRQASSLRTDVRYTPSDCFDTFPFPQSPSDQEKFRADSAGGIYYEHRRKLMLERQIGLTATYNLFHNPECRDADIVLLRELHRDMDNAILACYDWADLYPEHGFYQNDRGQTRYTVSHTARREILRRLLALNQEIAEKERNVKPVFGEKRY